MTEPAQGPQDWPSATSRWPIVLATYVAAALSLGASLSIGVLPFQLYPFIVGALVLTWCGLTVSAFRQWGAGAWPTTLGAPVALILPLKLMLLVAQCLLGKCLWWPG